MSEDMIDRYKQAQKAVDAVENEDKMTMTIDEAIRIHTVLQGAPVLKDDPKVIASLQLGIGALKRIRRQRKDLFPCEIKLLPGETEE